MTNLHWSVRCRACGEQLVADRPDSEFRCGRCGKVQPGVSPGRARVLEQVSLSQWSSADDSTDAPPLGRLLRALGRFFSRAVPL